MARDRLMGRTAVYRHYAAGDVLLYVGITLDPKARWSGHSDKAWRPLVERSEVVWYPNRRTAEAVERQAIEYELPLFNNQHNGYRGIYWSRILANPSKAFTSQRLLQLAVVVSLEPRILDVAAGAARMTAPYYCGECEWENNLRPKVRSLVGYEAEVEELRRPEFYEVAVAAVYELVPFCACDFHFFDMYGVLPHEVGA